MQIELSRVDEAPRRFRDLAPYMAPDDAASVLRLAAELRGLRVLFVNSNQNRGGVYEHLASLVPLLSDLGVSPTWLGATRVPPEFYEATKNIYNALQGSPEAPSARNWRDYDDGNTSVAAQIDRAASDVVMIQDHQFMGSRAPSRSRGGRRWVWQSHSETCAPNAEVREEFRRRLDPYDALIFYSPRHDFVTSGTRTLYSTIAIDPSAEKNLPMPLAEAQRRVSKYGFDTRAPLITQISRFDRWKDFPGVAEAWRLARTDIPGLQLALIGSITPNNVLAADIVEDLQLRIGHSTDARVLVNQVHGRDIKAFQTASSVVLQNSTREGFGLTVSEAMWSGTPVIGRRTSGIELQILDGETGYLVDCPEESASRVASVLSDPHLRQRLGIQGRTRVRENFLIGRLLHDELRLFASLVDGGAGGQDG